MRCFWIRWRRRAVAADGGCTLWFFMGNHYHLLPETPHANLLAGMRGLQGTCTKRFNIRHKAWGHLFQSRYKALLVDPGGEYFQTVCSYIHLNPARASCFDPHQGRLSDSRRSIQTSHRAPPPLCFRLRCVRGPGVAFRNRRSVVTNFSLAVLSSEIFVALLCKPFVNSCLSGVWVACCAEA
jgi:hypothetical protein